MRRASFRNLHRRTQGQSIMETALLLPIMLLIAFNAINFGYFFFVALNLAAAPRSGVQYSILGFATPKQLELPDPGPADTMTSVSYLTYQDVAGVLVGYPNARVQVCGSQLGLDAQQRAKCCQTASSSSACAANSNVAGHDPEYDSTANTTRFVRNQVDIFYDVVPIIPAFELPTPAGPISLTLVPNLTFHRQVSMRAME